MSPRFLTFLAALLLLSQSPLVSAFTSPAAVEVPPPTSSSPKLHHLIVYSGPTTPTNSHTVRLNDLYLQNLFFFLNKGLQCSSDSSTLYDVVIVVSEGNIHTYEESFKRYDHYYPHDHHHFCLLYIIIMYRSLLPGWIII